MSRVAGDLDAKVEECRQQILWLTAEADSGLLNLPLLVRPGLLPFRPGGNPGANRWFI